MMSSIETISTYSEPVVPSRRCISERKAEGMISFMLAEQELNDLVVPLLYDTVVLKAVTDVVVVVVEQTLVTADVTRELVQGDALIHSVSVLVGQSAIETGFQAVEEQPKHKVRGGCIEVVSMVQPDGPIFYTRARFARPHIRNDFVVDRMSLSLLDYVTAFPRVLIGSAKVSSGSLSEPSSLHKRSLSTQQIRRLGIVQLDFDTSDQRQSTTRDHEYRSLLPQVSETATMKPKSLFKLIRGPFRTLEFRLAVTCRYTPPTLATMIIHRTATQTDIRVQFSTQGCFGENLAELRGRYRWLQPMSASGKGCTSAISMRRIDRRLERVSRFPFLLNCKLMSRGFIEMHSVFREQEVSIESRKITISHRLYVIVRAERQVKRINGIASPIDHFSHSVGTFCAFCLQRLRSRSSWLLSRGQGGRWNGLGKYTRLRKASTRNYL
ncbi:hypothetical protein KCU62_g498, partial [Aureobasidium sp. EXF-3399]